MHLLVRDGRSLDEVEPAQDLGQSPAALLFLSFSDSDLGCAAAAWRAMGQGRPALRLASLARLRHPMSVDLYLDRVASHARGVFVRLLGGLDYWRYGAEELAALARRRGITLAVLPGDGAEDVQLAALGTVPDAARARLNALLRAGGRAHVGHALHLVAHLAGLGDDPGAAPAPLPKFGIVGEDGPADRPIAALVFYRSHLLAADTAPIDALADALRARGLAVRRLFAASLKAAEAAAFVAKTLRRWRPVVVVNATGFSARGDAGASPLDPADVPVLQVVLAQSSRVAWQELARGLGAADLAMQVVLPELDGRLLTGAVSFKEADHADPALEYAPVRHRPDREGVALAADRAAGWARLAATPRAERRVAIVLSDYPGVGGQVAHAVGLDAIASLAGILRLLHAAGYDTGDTLPDAAALVAALCHAPPVPLLDAATYRALFATLPEAAQARVRVAWGQPEDAIALRLARFGRITVAVQPDRGRDADRRATYHDPDLPPCHGYLGFYLWLREVEQADALVHLGAHGTLEWLPGKAVALSSDCFPTALLGGLPVIYPFIVSNPGEAAAAKRRLGAVVIGHLTPPLRAAAPHGAAASLERLLEEYAAADGLDRRRAALLRRDILDAGRSAGLLAECRVPPDAPEAEAITRLDAYLCDLKDLRIGDGLHVFGAAPAPEQRVALLADCPEAALDASPAAERAALLAALDGRFVPPGPAGAPSRGRADVLPTGRNLCAIDPRAVPTPSALALAGRTCAELLRRHVQEIGDWPRRIVLDLWGSATMRTGGEELALALLLLGARPLWDEGTGRVRGVEVVALAELDRPRVDVTLRVSGLFRDAFPAQMALFATAVRLTAARDEAPEWNPLAQPPGAPVQSRIYGPAPGCYGAGEGNAESYLAASAHAYAEGEEGRVDRAGFAACVTNTDALLHMQDHAETDVLDGPERAMHEAGFAAAAASLGARPALWHADTCRPDAPRIRALAEEVARVARGRAANPEWIAGMMRHGYRGAAEIARSLEALVAFAGTLPERFDASFDLLFDATLGEEAVDRFLQAENPEAREAMRSAFARALARGLWRPHRNTVAALLEPAE